MSPKLARILASLALFSQLVLWVALAVGIIALMRSLEVANNSIKGDVASVEAILARAQPIVGWGKLIGLIGFIVLLVLVLNGVERARWFLWGGLVSSAVCFFLFPVGTVLGGMGLLLFMRALRRPDNPAHEKA